MENIALCDGNRGAQKKFSETPSFHQSHYGGAACFDSCACKHCYILLTVFLLSCCSAALRCALVLCEVEELLQQRMLFAVYIYSTMMNKREMRKPHRRRKKRNKTIDKWEWWRAHFFPTLHFVEWNLQIDRLIALLLFGILWEYFWSTSALTQIKVNRIESNAYCHSTQLPLTMTLTLMMLTISSFSLHPSSTALIFASIFSALSTK